MNTNYNPYLPSINPYIYDRIAQLMQYYLSSHSKAFLVRADIRYPENYPGIFDKIHIQRCMEKTIKYLKRHGYDPMYVWVRECHIANHPHYHCMFLMNGHETRSPGLIYDTLARYWASSIGADATGLIHRCEIPLENNPYQFGQMIYRSQGIPENVYNIMNYLAKDFTKGEYKDGLRDFGMSRLS